MDKMRKLCEICDFQGGSQPPKEEWSTEVQDGYIRMLQIRDFTQGDRVIPEFVKKTRTIKTCDKDDILIARYGASVGKILTGLSGAYNVAIMKTIPNTNIIEKRYLYYFLMSKNFQNFILNVGSRAAQAGFNKADLSKIEIYCPEKDTQKKIVLKLDLLNVVIEKRKQQLLELDLLVKSQFIEMFGDLKTNSKGWQIVRFKDCADIDTNMVHDFEGYEDYPHIGIDSIEKETGSLIGYRTIAEDGVISGKYLFTPKHIIYSKIRPNLNKVAMPDFEGLCSADAYPILVKEGICNREYFGYTLRSQYFLDYILTFSNRTNLPKVNRSQVEGFTLPLPPIDRQNQFATFVQQVDKSKLAVQKSLEELETLKQALMQQYFGRKEEGKNLEHTGIKSVVLEEIKELAKKSGVKKVILFGSRARGNFERASDIDLAVKGGDITQFTLDVKEETSTLLDFDVINLEEKLQEKLLDSIRKEGITIYEEV